MMEADKLKCPKCGAEYDDYDGLVLLYCPRCGYCTHGATTRKAHLEICEVCGREIRLERLRPLVYHSIEMDGQRVLSVKNPWAYLIIHHGKDVENRSWSTKYRGRILIHASKEMPAGYLGLFDRLVFSGMIKEKEIESYLDELSKIKAGCGCIIGSVELYDCVKGSKSVWAEPYSQYHWLLRDPRPFDIPLPVRGMMGLWTYHSQPASGED